MLLTKGVPVSHTHPVTKLLKARHALGDGIQMSHNVMVEMVFKLFKDRPSLADLIFGRIGLTIESIIVEHFGKERLVGSKGGDGSHDFGGYLK
jgi:hypothetical protein